MEKFGEIGEGQATEMMRSIPDKKVCYQSLSTAARRSHCNDSPIIIKVFMVNLSSRAIHWVRSIQSDPVYEEMQSKTYPKFMLTISAKL